MNKRPIEQANDADLRSSIAVMDRADIRAREVARRSGISMVITRNGVIEHLAPDAPELNLHEARESPADCGDKA